MHYYIQVNLLEPFSTVLELLIVGIDGELLVSGSKLLRVSVSTVTRQKNSDVHDQLSFSLLHM